MPLDAPTTLQPLTGPISIIVLTTEQKNAAIKAQIDGLEREYLINRDTPEFCMAAILMQAINSRKTELWLLDPKAGNPFYIKLNAVDNQILAMSGNYNDLSRDLGALVAPHIT